MIVLMQLISHFKSIKKLEQLKTMFEGLGNRSHLNKVVGFLDMKYGIELTLTQVESLERAMNKGHFRNIDLLSKMR